MLDTIELEVFEFDVGGPEFILELIIEHFGKHVGRVARLGRTTWSSIVTRRTPVSMFPFMFCKALDHQYTTLLQCLLNYNFRLFKQDAWMLVCDSWDLDNDSLLCPGGTDEDTARQGVLHY